MAKKAQPRRMVNGTDPDAKCGFIPNPARFSEWGAEFIASPELDEIASGLISLHESRFHHLQDWTVRCLWKKLALTFRQLGFDDLEPGRSVADEVAKALVDGIGAMEGVESVTVSAGGKSATIPAGGRRK